MPKKLTIGEMRKIAKSRGGKCLSARYTGVFAKMRWRCGEGHIWSAMPHDIKGGRWCPKCAIEKRAASRRLTIEEMQRIAESREGKCLSKHYSNCKTKLVWRCKKGHTWKASPQEVKAGTWCPKCFWARLGFSKRLTIEEMRAIAGARGGACLSKRYVNNETKLTWQCAKGHVWNAIPSSVKLGTWCPKCRSIKAGDARRLSIEEIQKTAERFGGRCLSTQYVNSGTKLEWQCKEGHTWWAAPNSVRQGCWCRKCAFSRIAASQRLTIEEMQKTAESRGGKCLSTEYANVNTKLEWQCGKGHVWKAGPSSIRAGSWCPVCARTKFIGNRRLPFEAIKEFARKRGGECISLEYPNDHAYLSWKCKEGHEWRARYCTIRRKKRWCPVCRKIRAKRRSMLAQAATNMTLPKLYDLFERENARPCEAPAGAQNAARPAAAPLLNESQPANHDENADD